MRRSSRLERAAKVAAHPQEPVPKPEPKRNKPKRKTPERDGGEAAPDSASKRKCERKAGLKASKPSKASDSKSKSKACKAGSAAQESAAQDSAAQDSAAQESAVAQGSELGKPRCHWASSDARRLAYHDEHWGRETRCAAKLFRILSLCSQQAGVSWRVVWSKREAYDRCFADFDLASTAAMTDADVEALVADDGNGVMHNRAKLRAIVNNARICKEIDDSFDGGLSRYLWSFSAHEPVVNAQVWSAGVAASNTSSTSDAMAKDMKRRGFSYLGSITLHAFCEQVGIVNNHCRNCFLNPLSAAV